MVFADEDEGEVYHYGDEHYRSAHSAHGGGVDNIGQAEDIGLERLIFVFLCSPDLYLAPRESRSKKVTRGPAMDGGGEEKGKDACR